MASKKTARKKRVQIMPISQALSRGFGRANKLRLVKSGKTTSKFCEIALEKRDKVPAVERALGATHCLVVREGKLGTAGKPVLKVSCRPFDAQTIAVRQAQMRIASGWTVEGVKLDAPQLAAWLAEVKRIGRSSRDWMLDAERIFLECAGRGR